MADEKKKERKQKTPRTEKEQAFMDQVHTFRQLPFRECWQLVEKAALAFKREKTGDDAAEL